MPARASDLLLQRDQSLSVATRPSSKRNTFRRSATAEQKRADCTQGIQGFTGAGKSLGVANRDFAIIEAVHPDGRLSARLDNNRQIEFNSSEHGHFDHGYAVTSHSSQGLTAERVLVHADTRVHPDLLNFRFGYVSISRASHEATLFTDDLAKLGPQLEAGVSKTSSLEINHYEPSRTMSSNGVLLQI